MDIKDLRGRWVGKNVRTERPLTLEEFFVWFPMGHPVEDWFPGYRFGGEGEVVDFVDRDGRVWIQVDWGYEWVIDDQTDIFEVIDVS